MKIATWNVNSLKARWPRVEGWLGEHQPDVLFMQETKSTDDAFPSAALADLGYESVHHGNGRWNGVAIASHVGLEAPRAGFVDDDLEKLAECRIVAATCGGIECFSVYVPNGRTVDSEHYVAKLEWLGRLRAELDQRVDPSADIVIGGDFNVAPEDRDVWDITAFEGMTHVTDPERQALRHIGQFGLVDAVRHLHPDGPGPFSWWDYRGGSFHRGLGMRIDHFLVSSSVLGRLRSAEVDREARKGSQPSDHAPVVLELD